MAGDVVPQASYLDLDDPFETSGSLCSKVSRPNSRIDGNESGELSDDSNNDAPLSQSSSNEKTKEIDHAKRKERAKAVSNMWGETLRTSDNQVVKSMLDGPSAWPFGSPDSYESGFRSDEESDIREDACLQPQVLRARSERLLTMDIRKIDNMHPRELRSYVSQAAALAQEHDKLIDGRNKLFNTMLEMYDSEREQTIQLVDKLQEHTDEGQMRTILKNMSNSLNEMGTRDQAEKRGTRSIFPSMLQPSGVPNLAFPPPLPDVSRPPPMLPSLDTSVPPPNMRTQFSVAPPMLGMPPPHMMNGRFSGPPPMLPPPPPGLPPPINGILGPMMNGADVVNRRHPFIPGRNGPGGWSHPRSMGIRQQHRGYIDKPGYRSGRSYTNFKADSISP